MFSLFDRDYAVITCDIIYMTFIIILYRCPVKIAHAGKNDIVKMAQVKMAQEIMAKKWQSR